MTIHHISDTHTFHDDICPHNVPVCDLIVHSGDCTHGGKEVDKFNTEENRLNTILFLEWFKDIKSEYQTDSPHKIYVPGNHDLFIARKPTAARDLFESYGIELLIDQSTTFQGVSIYGSPVTPTYKNFEFMKSNSGLFKHWEKIDENVEILITHGPPKGILDLAYEYINNKPQPKQVGDLFLLNKLKKLHNLKLHLFGHVHNTSDFYNTGVLRSKLNNVTFSNASGVINGKFELGVVFTGNTLHV